MRNIIFSLLMIPTVFCFSSEQTATPLTTLSLRENESFEFMNNKGEFILSDWEWSRNECFCNYYYSHVDFHQARICITDLIGDELSQMGFEPISVRNTHSPEYNIYLTYPNCLDDFGNVLVSFGHKGEKDVDGNCPRKLGVWQKERGFQLLNVSKIEYVYSVLYKDDTVVVTGREKAGSSKKTVVILSVKEGFFGERKGS